MCDGYSQIIVGKMFDFIQEVSNGRLTIPLCSSYMFISYGWILMKIAHHRICCVDRHVRFLDLICQGYETYDIRISSRGSLKRVGNVLLNGLQKLNFDVSQSSQKREQD